MLASVADAGWLSLAGICLAIVGGIGRQLANGPGHRRDGSLALRTSQAGVIMLAIGLWRTPATFWATDVYFAFVPWLLSVGLLVPEWGGRESAERTRWRALALLLAFGGDLPLVHV